MSDIYDGAFRTIVNDCKQFVLPFINEVFGEAYDGTELIEFHPNEHFIDPLEEPDKRRITDTNFSVIGRQIKKYHLECESSKYSSKILIRLFEYDTQIALDEGEVGVDEIKVTFPHTAVLYLRDTKKTPDRMLVQIEVPGASARYYVPIAKIVKYSIDEIFQKKVYILIPFYIFTYEADFDEYNTDKEKLAELHGQYQLIIDRLSELVEKEEITAFDKKTIVDITDDVVRELTKKYTKLQKEVGDLMSGAMLETEARRLRDEYLQEGINLGISQGIGQGISQVAENMIRAQKPAEEIESMTGFSIDKLKELATKIGVMLVL